MKLEQLKVAFEAATRGEWRVHWKLQWSVRVENPPPYKYVSGGRDGTPLSEEDAEFIAQAHNLMPHLFEALTLLDEYEQWANGIEDDNSRVPIDLRERYYKLLNTL